MHARTNPRSPKGRRRTPILVAAVATLAAVTLCALAVRSCADFDLTIGPDGSTESYCLTFDPLDRSLRLVRSAIHEARSQEPGAKEGLLAFFWTAEVTKGAPASSRADADVVLDAVRRSLRLGSEIPLRDPRVVRAVRRLAPGVERTCARYRSAAD